MIVSGYHATAQAEPDYTHPLLLHIQIGAKAALMQLYDCIRVHQDNPSGCSIRLRRVNSATTECETKEIKPLLVPTNEPNAKSLKETTLADLGIVDQTKLMIQIRCSMTAEWQ